MMQLPGHYSFKLLLRYSHPSYHYPLPLAVIPVLLYSRAQDSRKYRFQLISWPARLDYVSILKSNLLN